MPAVGHRTNALGQSEPPGAKREWTESQFVEPEVPRGDAEGDREGADGGSAAVHAAQHHEDGDGEGLKLTAVRW